MSIFKDTFPQSVQDQIVRRQNSISERQPLTVQYLNSRNAWIRMTSCVNLLVGQDADGNDLTDDGALARQYTLQGGILRNDGEGIRQAFSNNYQSDSYSNSSPANQTYLRGIRPMPGIINAEIKSKSAYGSLREVTVNFTAWDIKQLEDLELLYMRAGYSVLIEWGWLPYISNSNKYTTSTNHYNINPDVKKGESPVKNKEEIFVDLFKKSTEEHNGNYDAMYGLIKNYSWSARMDGGYDCTVNVISIGEILESLKMNYSPFDNNISINTKGIIASTIPGIDMRKFTELSSSYNNNIVAGICYEMYTIGSQLATQRSSNTTKFGNKEDVGFYTSFSDNKGNTYDIFKKSININGEESPFGTGDEQIYITLESFTTLLNEYVLLKDGESGRPLCPISVKERTYNGAPGNYLEALAYPLQISIDPRICLISSPLWTKGFKVPSNSIVSDADLVIGPFGEGKNYDKIIYDLDNSDGSGALIILRDNFRNKLEELKELQRQYQIAHPGSSIYKMLRSKGIIDPKLIGTYIGVRPGEKPTKPRGTVRFDYMFDAISQDPITLVKAELEPIKNEIDNNTYSPSDIKFLNNLNKKYFKDNEWKSERGIIGNIYVNLKYLYKLSLSHELESQDKKEKNDINTYDYLKTLMANISTSIGEVNNFDIHIDPIDHVARIIDINYVDDKDRNNIYNNAFTLEVHNTKSIVRSYNLQSQIFQEQSTIVAIGAQVGGGQLGTDSNTMVEFNRGLLDRVIPKKLTPTVVPLKNNLEDQKQKLRNLSSSLKVLNNYFNRLHFNIGESDYDVSEFQNYRNSLKDLINYFKSISKSDIKNRAIIPTKLHIEMDGIGGIIIGNIFKLPDEVLPRGYKGGAVGSRLGYVVTGIAHSINNNDWITKLEAQTVILDDPKDGIDIKFEEMVISDPASDGLILAPIPGSIISTDYKGKATIFQQNAIRTAITKTFEAGPWEGRCNKYSHSIAKNYVDILNPKKGTPTSIGKFHSSGGDAGEESAIVEFERLNYYRINMGIKTKEELRTILGGEFDLGDVVMYFNITNGTRQYPYHTQIYTGGLQNDSNGSKWVTSDISNYGTSFVYGNDDKYPPSKYPRWKIILLKAPQQ